MNSSLRFWLIFSFTIVIFITITTLFIFISNQRSIDKLEASIDILQNTRIALLETNRIKEDIFISELINPDFYENEYSLQERKLDVYFNRTYKLLSKLKKSGLTSEERSEILLIENKLNKYKTTFKQLIQLFKYKGYKNYGIEGKMRDYVHEITNYNDPQIKLYSLLLRKHEKDFLIRKELFYISSFNNVTHQLIHYIYNNHRLAESEKNRLLNLVYFYNKYFKIIARVEHKIGVKSKQGLLNLSSNQFEELHSDLDNIESKLIVEEQVAKSELKIKSIFIFASITLFLFIIVAVLTNIITRSVSHITQTFSNYINSGFTHIPNGFRRSRIKEFNVIYIDFIKMAKEINTYTNFFKEKVLERTLEINKQKEEIEIQQKKIEVQYNDLLKVNGDLVDQRHLLKNRNKEMLESLRYAKRIQKALLPKSNAYNKFFTENFVFVKAKDVVSGDFNLIYPIKTQTAENIIEDQVVLISADSTGHGVPGALISVLGINSINKMVNLLNIHDPGKLLDSLDKDINDFLSIDKKDRDVVLDGMDISVLSFNPKTHILKYSIAKYYCYIIRNSEVLDLFDHDYSIGYNIIPLKEKKFFTHSIQLHQNDRLYIFSDGFSDQFGGAENKKYKRKNLLNLLLNIHLKPMKEQKLIIKKEFKDWRGKNDQTDDITVIGLRF